MSLILINSGAYVDPELVAEFGKLPPAFLPVGHQRLYEAQLDTLSHVDGDVILTIPESYQLPEVDEMTLKGRAVRTLCIPDGMRLGEAILYALDVLSPANQPVRLLHGDTLLRDAVPKETNLVVVASPPENYDWGRIDHPTEQQDSKSLSSSEVLAGYFAFNSGTELRQSLAQARGDFIIALQIYNAVVPLKRVHSCDWLDFGHLQTYYRSRCKIQTQRAFNELDLSFKSVKKSSSNVRKIEAEAHWYQSIPDGLKLYTPAFLGANKKANGQSSYSLEYLPLPTLHELFVFGDLSEGSWHLILQSCNDFLIDCQTHSENRNDIEKGDLSTLTREKTFQRLEEFCVTSGISKEDEWRFGGRPLPSLMSISQIATEAIDFDDNRFLGIMHGDLCFTNIFYDFRTQRIRVIDPRGSVDGDRPSIWGDSRYDIAKMGHSVVGGYDLILAGRFKCEGIETRDVQFSFAPSRSMKILEELKIQSSFLGVTLKNQEIVAIMIHLFISMLPLHSDTPMRQKAFIANALRLFCVLEEQL